MNKNFKLDSCSQLVVIFSGSLSLPSLQYIIYHSWVCLIRERLEMIKVSLRKVNGLRLPLHTRTRTITTTTSTSTHLVSVEPTTTLAILGGGLSGLSTAFYFLRNLSPTLKQSTRVIIYEKQLRSGGWCQSIAIPTPAHSHSENEVEQSNRSRSNSIESNQSTPNSDQAQLVFETGPRSIRPVGLPGWLTVELVREYLSSPFRCHVIR